MQSMALNLDGISTPFRGDEFTRLARRVAGYGPVVRR